MAKNYLVIGTGERGVSSAVLRLFNQVAEYTGADVIYTGALSTDDAIRMYERRIRRIRTFENKLEYEDYQPSEETYNYYARDVNEVNHLVAIQDSLIEGVVKYFPKQTIHWVTNPALFIPLGLIQQIDWLTHMDITKYITVTPVGPNGTRVSSNPLTPRSISMYSYYNNSVVAPHPIVATRPFAKEGINKTLQFMTTGALRFPNNAQRPSETHEHVSQPAAILLTIDEATGVFLHQRIHVDRFANGQLGILWDGLLFTSGDIVEVPSKDRMSGLTDSHGKNKDLPTWQAQLLLADLHEPEEIIHGGDLGDFPSLNPHQPPQSLSHDGLRLKEDFRIFRQDVQELLSPKSVKRLVILESNHHEWVTRYVDKHKTLQGLIDLDALQESLPDNVVLRKDIPGQDSYSWGNYIPRHGHVDGSVTSLANMFQHVPSSNGHFHAHEEYRNAIRIGCSCTHMSYMKGSTDKWVLQIYSGTKHRGVARIHVKTIVKKKGRAMFCYRGQIYSVKA